MGRVGHDGILGNRVKEEGEEWREGVEGGGGEEKEGARREIRGKRGEKGEEDGSGARSDFKKVNANKTKYIDKQLQTNSKMISTGKPDSLTVTPAIVTVSPPC